MRAAIYCRISRDPQGTELGVRRQQADGLALCEREGWEIAGVFIDDDRSAYSGKPRPGFSAMRDLVMDDNVDVVVAWHPDRLTRHPRELEDLIDLLEATSTTVRTVQAGEYDLGTPSGRMAARIVGAVARHESEHKSARLRRKHVELAEAGKVSGGGDRPFGYERDRITVRANEADIVRSIAADVLAGDSLRTISRRLNATSVRTTAGLAWYPSAVRRLLLSPRIAGLRGHRGTITGAAVWPAIIPPDDHYRLVAVLTDPARRKHPGGRDRKLLTGLLTCGHCNATMVSRPRQDRVATYVCASGPGMHGCGRMRILGEPLDDLITAAVLHRLDSPAMAAALASRVDDEPIVAELQQVEQRRRELAEMWSNGEVGKSDWRAATAALDARQDALESQLAAVTQRHAVTPMSASIVGRWPDLSHDRRRAVLAAVIKTVEIGPAVRGRNYFDADRVSITWRA